MQQLHQYIDSYGKRVYFYDFFRTYKRNKR